VDCSDLQNLKYQDQRLGSHVATLRQPTAQERRMCLAELTLVAALTVA
jgi:hypothetical protein